MDQLVALYTQQYNSNVQLLLQQRGSKLRGLVNIQPCTGKQASPVDQIGSTNARKRSARYDPIQPANTPTDRRWVFPVDYDWAETVETMDKLRANTGDINSPLVIAGTYAMGRSQDDEIIAAFFGTSKTGETGATSTTFPAGQQVGVNVGGSASGLNVAKLREARRLFMAAEVDLDMEQIKAAITSKQHDNLLNEVQVISTDFNDRPVLVDGKVRRAVGIDFTHIERLTLDGSSYRRCPFWVQSGMSLGMWMDVETSITRREDLRGRPWQVYIMGTYGATRLEEKRVVEVKCAES